ncbi:MAG: hypothetical protein ABIH92_01425 [Nanoarchaeota archaeon]
MINTSNLQKAKNEIKTAKHPIIIQSQDLEFNRKMLEYGKFDILLSPELTGGWAGKFPRDKLKQLSSGLNHIMAKIAAKNGVAIGIDLQAIRSISNKKQKAQTIARIIQNIKTCRKAECGLVLLNYKDKKDAFEFLISLGASTKQAKEAL